MVSYSQYPADPRVRREAEAMVEAGFQTNVICLTEAGARRIEIVNGVRVLRLPLERRRGGHLRYFWQYTSFFVLSFLAVSSLHLRKHYQFVHVHNMPEFLVFCAIVPWLCGARIILDLHDPSPEVYMAKYRLDECHVMVRLLQFLESRSIKISKLVLTPNTAFRNLFISRGCPPSKIHVVMNTPQAEIFRRAGGASESHRRSDKFLLMYHGTITKRNGLVVALEAVAHARKRIPNLMFHVYGEGDFIPEFLRRTKELGLSDIVTYRGCVSQAAIAAAIQSIDLGVVPCELSKQWELAMPTRVFEYLCLGKPVIVPRTRGIQDYFSEDSIHFFEPGEAPSLAAKIIEVYNDPVGTQAVLERGMSVCLAHRWEVQKHNLVDLVSALVE